MSSGRLQPSASTAEHNQKLKRRIKILLSKSPVDETKETPEIEAAYALILQSNQYDKRMHFSDLRGYLDPLKPLLAAHLILRGNLHYFMKRGFEICASIKKNKDACSQATQLMQLIIDKLKKEGLQNQFSQGLALYYSYQKKEDLYDMLTADLIDFLITHFYLHNDLYTKLVDKISLLIEVPNRQVLPYESTQDLVAKLSKRRFSLCNTPVNHPLFAHYKTFPPQNTLEKDTAEKTPKRIKIASATAEDK